MALKRQLCRVVDGAPQVRSRERRAKAAQAAFDSEREAVDTAAAKGMDHFRARARYIERVRIENIASIEKLELDLRASTADRAPCFALLGNNGVGKSSVLKAIALALAGPAHVHRLGLKATSLLRDHAAGGLVRVWLAGYREPVEMQLTRRGNRIHHARPESLQLVLGYLQPAAAHAAAPPARRRAPREDRQPLRPLPAAHRRAGLVADAAGAPALGRHQQHAGHAAAA